MPHIIDNFDEIATDGLRTDALTILEAGLMAVDTERALREKINLEKETLTIDGQMYELKNFDRLFVIGFGKAAFRASKTLEDILGDKINGGVALDVESGDLRHIDSVAGTHPLPSVENMRATGEIIGILKDATEDDLILTVVSGGGSALLCWPYDQKCETTRQITDALMDAGATIHETNTVRKHIDEIKGGQFVEMAAPATIAGLIFSDVPGDDLSMIASGPTVLDTTTAKEARGILEKYDVLKTCKLSGCDLKETPKDPDLFKHANNTLIVSNTMATDAMAKKAEDLGYEQNIYSNTLSGEARDVGEMLAGQHKPSMALIAAGETTVTITGDGKGGRNQELVLGALSYVPDDALLLSCASDGIDNTPVAGAIADKHTKNRAEKLGLDPEKFLENNDSFHFFQQTGSHIKTGVTGRNISDLMLVLHK